MKEIKDEQLIVRFLRGNDNAFELLLNRYLKSIYNFTYRLTKDPSAADDLTQEVFLKVWKNLKRFDQSKKFKVWLFSIARNTTYDYFKKKKTIPFVFFEDGEGSNKMDYLADDKILPNELLIKADLANNLNKFLKKIPEKYRIVLIMHYKDDFSLKEIAEILKKSYNTVKSQHQRGLRMLRKLL